MIIKIAGSYRHIQNAVNSCFYFCKYIIAGVVFCNGKLSNNTADIDFTAAIFCSSSGNSKISSRSNSIFALCNRIDCYRETCAISAKREKLQGSQMKRRTIAITLCYQSRARFTFIFFSRISNVAVTWTYNCKSLRQKSSLASVKVLVANFNACNA